MTRSHWKGPFVDAFLIRKIARAPDKRSPFKVWTRRSLIIPQFVGKLFAIYNGRKFVKILISEDMVGHKLGEFSPTRARAKHKKKNKKK